MSAATFPCPHCGITYPFKPVLVGRTVRCTSCKQAFRLREDGRAEAVAPAAEAGPPPAGAAQAGATASQRRPTERFQLSDQQHEQRRSMAASLTSAMGKALQAEAPPPGGSQRTGRPRSSRFFTPQAEGKRKPGPAVLTGEGEREAANLRAWTLGALAVLALAVALGWLLTLSGPRRAALDAFTALVPDADNRYGRRAEAIRARAWLAADRPGGAGVAPFIVLGDPRLGPVRRIPGTALGEALGRLKDLGWSAIPGVWASDPALAARLGRDGLAALLAAAPEHRLTVLDPATLAARIASDGIDEEDARVVVALLLGETAPGRNALAEQARRTLPTAIEWCSVEGRDGLLLIDTGSSYQSRARAFRGILLRFAGPGWPADWRVLSLAPASA